MLAHHGLDRVGQASGIGPSPTAAARYEDHACMAATICQRLCRNRTKVLDVVGDDGAPLAIRAVENLAIGLSNQIGALDHPLGIQAALAQKTRYSRREMLIQQHLHEASACWPAFHAA